MQEAIMQEMGNETLCTSCDELLQRAIEIYERIYLIYIRFHNTPQNSKIRTMQPAFDHINSLYREAAEIDKRIKGSLQITPKTDETDALILRRGELLEKLTKMNKNLSKKTSNIKSMLKHEIATMSGNRTAIRGYKPVTAPKRRIFSSTM